MIGSTCKHNTEPVKNEVAVGGRRTFNGNDESKARFDFPNEYREINIKTLLMSFLQSFPTPHRYQQVQNWRG